MNRKIIKNIVVVIIVLLMLSNTVYAKYIKTEVLNGKQEIAKPILNIQKGEIVQINNENTEGEYKFTVVNYSEQEISDIGFEYTIEVILKNKDIIEVELYNSNGIVPMNEYITEKIEIKGKQKIEHQYTLKIKYNKEKERSEAIIENLQIKINAEQEKI